MANDYDRDNHDATPRIKLDKQTAQYIRAELIRVAEQAERAAATAGEAAQKARAAVERAQHLRDLSHEMPSDNAISGRRSQAQALALIADIAEGPAAADSLQRIAEIARVALKG